MRPTYPRCPPPPPEALAVFESVASASSAPPGVALRINIRDSSASGLLFLLGSLSWATSDVAATSGGRRRLMSILSDHIDRTALTTQRLGQSRHECRWLVENLPVARVQPLILLLDHVLHSLLKARVDRFERLIEVWIRSRRLRVTLWRRIQEHTGVRQEFDLETYAEPGRAP